MAEAPPLLLVVDDDASKRYGTARVLQRDGYRVLEGESGQDALRLVHEAAPDLVLLDVNLPDVSGFEVVRTLRALPGGPGAQVPVLLMSARFVRDEDRAAGLESGADGYLTYPLEPPVLRAQVRALLRAVRAERERARVLEAERAAHARMELLAEAGAVLTASLEPAQVLEGLGGLLVPRFASSLRVHLAGAEAPRLFHARPEGRAALERLEREHPLPPGAPGGWPHATREGTPERLASVDAAALRAEGREGAALAAALALGEVSRLVLPLTVGRATLGALVLGREADAPPFDAADETVGLELARRAAVALDHARLYALARRERRRVEEANRAKDEFLATVSHELRTPLSAILGWAQLLKSGRLDAARVERAVGTIERNALAQAQLIDDLLDVSRITTGRMRLSLRRVEPPRVLEAALEAVRPAAEARGVTLHAHAAPDVPALRADADRLQQVAWNLLSNAIKFTPHGGRVDARLAVQEGQVALEVADTGQGIPADFLPHVFERFRQADGSFSRAHGGLGLGLAIVRHLVELHGGTVEAHSAGEGQGARFVVRLPVGDAAEADAPAPAPALLPTPAGATDCPMPELRGVRVLVVDDEADSRELLRELLEGCGARVETAGSAAEGLARLRELRPDVLVSDVGMPLEDGYALIRRVRALPAEEGGRTPALALTAYTRTEDRTRALLSGYQFHVPKPIVAAELLAMVAMLAGRTPTPA